MLGEYSSQVEAKGRRDQKNDEEIGGEDVELQSNGDERLTSSG